MATTVPSEKERKKSLDTLRMDIEKKTGKTPEQLYDEREKRVMDTIALKEPDRVPVAFHAGLFPLIYAGLPLSAAFYDPAPYREAVIKTVLEFEPDLFQIGPNTTVSGVALEALNTKQMRWPGGTLPPDYGHQAVDIEYMKADEYDLFMTDLTDFMLRCFLPRAFGVLEPLAKLPHLGEGLATSTLSGFFHMTPLLSKPDFQKVARVVLAAGEQQAKFRQLWEGVTTGLGFPPFSYPGGAGGAPFDLIATSRGTRGVMADMFRQPDKLLAACERLLEWRIARAAPFDPKKKDYFRRIGASGFHFGADNYMLRKHFEKFLWPTFKKAILKNIELGYVTTTYCEGRADDRVEYFAEFPKGKTVFRFADSDMKRAKAILAGHCCIEGNVPMALMQVGSPQEVEEYCKDLIKVCGKGGGFILCSASGLDTAKPANVKAMIDSAKKYGRY